MDDNSQNPNHFAHYVRTEEPQIKPPPRLETGALKWMRENLFSSSLNTILTLLGFFIAVYSIFEITRWAIQDANWHAVLFNMRFLMLGRFEAEYEWRIPVLMYFSCMALGAGIAVWVRKVARLMLVTTVIVGIFAFLVPLAIFSNVPLPSFYMTAGNVPIAQGSVTEMPVEQIAFVGAEGENISIRIAEDVTSEESLAGIAGFIDRSSNTLRNASRNRLDAIQRHGYLETILADDANSSIPRLTTNQRTAYTTEFEAYSEVAPIIETYALNQNAVRISIINAETQEALREPLDLSVGETFSVTLPETGWYILQKEYVPGESIAEGLVLLDVNGIYPLLQSSSFDSESGGFVDDFVRISDGLRLRDPLPQIEGTNARFVNIIENKYFGARSFGDYLSAYLAPFLNSVGLPIVIYFLLGILGYWLTISIARLRGKSAATRFAALILALIPVLFWIFVNGIYAYTALMWLLVIAMLLACAFVNHLAKQRGNQPIVYILALLIYIGIVAILLGTGGFDLGIYMRLYTLLLEPAGLPRFILWLSIIFLTGTAYSGAKSYIAQTGRSYGISLAFITILLFVVACVFLFDNPLLALTGLQAPVHLGTDWPLQPTSPNDWGGLLLVMAITIYGIIIAFPIGVGLALGRRSDLPIIKAICIGYIEFVRGVPFITVLFFVQLLLPLLNAELAELSNTYRAIIATILFSAAYLAENVRGGLQSLPPGQSEAAKALGLSSWQMTTLITLPQALRAVIPALVGQFIGLFKDTSLVSIVGLVDLVKAVDVINSQTAFSGTRLEGLFFISIIYFVFSYVMAYVSRLLEASGSGVTRRM